MPVADLRSALADIVAQRRATNLGTGVPFAVAPVAPGAVLAVPKTAQGSRAQPISVGMLPMRYDERPPGPFQFSVLNNVLLVGYARDLSAGSNAKFTSQVGGATPNPQSAKHPNVDPGADSSQVPPGPPNLNSSTF